MIAAGIGCRKECTPLDIIRAVHACAGSHGQRPEQIRALCSAEFKSSAEPLQRAARELNIPLLCFPLDVLERHSAQALTSSSVVREHFALPSIAETAALAGAVELLGGLMPVRLLGARQLVGAVACALAAPVELCA